MILNAASALAQPLELPRLPRQLAALCSRLAARVIAVPLGLIGADGGQSKVFFLAPQPDQVLWLDRNRVWPDERAGALRFCLDVDGEIWCVRMWGVAAEELQAPPAHLTGMDLEAVPADLRPLFLALTLDPLLERASAALGRVFRLRLDEWPAEQCPADERPAESCAADERPAESCAADERPAEICPAEICPAEICPAEICPAEQCPAEERRIEEWPAESCVLPFALRDAQGKAAGAGALRLPCTSASFSALAEGAKVFPRRRADMADLPLTLSLCAGREAFPLELLRRAEPGDAVLFTLPAEPALTLDVQGRALWKAALADGKILLGGALRGADIKEACMSQKAETRLADDSASGAESAAGLAQADLDALEIVLTLELDELRISLRELAALAPGHTLETSASLETPVTIKANGRALGTGRLAAIGERLGVIVTSWRMAGIP